MIKTLSSTFSSRAARVVVNVLAVLVLLVQFYLLYRWETYARCAEATAQRGQAISAATDRERAAERELLEAPSEERRLAVLAARAEVDRVRAANPAETC